MKRLFCLLLFTMLFISLTACGAHNGNLETNRSEATDNTTADSSNFESVDLSYENVAKLTDFKCYVSYQEKDLTIDGTRAKDLYNIVHNEMNKREHTPTFSYGNNVHLVFYNSKEEYPSKNINAISFWGTYTIYEDGLLVFSGSPFHSAAFAYKIESSLYNSVIDIISNEN